MPTTLSALAQLVGGRVAGDSALEISGAATLLDCGPGDVTLVDKIERAPQLASSPARAVVVPHDVPTDALPVPAIVVADVHAAFAAIVTHFRPARTRSRKGICPGAFVSGTARLADDVDVHPGASVADDAEIGAGSTLYPGARVMDGCRLGRNVTLHPNAVLYEGTIVGDNSIVHSGAVLGANGFGYRLVDGTHQPSAQLGWVEIGRDCEIGACSTVDRGTYGPTIIGDGSKLDNLVMIGHNCQLGRHNMICSQVGIAGSTTTGDYVVMAGQVGVRDHVHIGTRAVLGAKCGISSDVPDDAHMLGTPAIRERDQKILFAAIFKLPELRRQFKRLERLVESLVSGSAASSGTASSGTTSSGTASSNSDDDSRTKAA
jgi:UDP-3-O-[3-hydroxymyristoyl] glucosamine N-acyltransferase